MLRAAYLCGLIPLAVGVGVFWTWRITGFRPFILVGVSIILVGLLSFVLGVVLLVMWGKAQRLGGASTSRVIRGAAAPALLLLVNFPVAFLCVIGAESGLNAIDVAIVNSGARVDNITFAGCAAGRPSGPIKSGGRKAVTLAIRAEGGVRFVVERGGNRSRGDLSGYVTDSIGPMKVRLEIFESSYTVTQRDIATAESRTFED